MTVQITRSLMTMILMVSEKIPRFKDVLSVDMYPKPEPVTRYATCVLQPSGIDGTNVTGRFELEEV